MSPEDEEALRLMQEEEGGYDGDLRGEGDPDWLANGAQIELFGLQSDKAKVLNGQTAEVIGFDNEHRRYRVRLHSDSTVKVVSKKNMRLLPPEEDEPAEAFQAPGPPTGTVRLGPAPIPPGQGQLQTLAPTASVELVPTVGTVRRSIDKVSQCTRVLAQHCELRRSGVTGNAMSDVYLALNVAMDTYTEVIDMYEAAYGGTEDGANASMDMRRLGDAACRTADEYIESYQGLRSWAEYAADEVNLTRYSIRKHGVVGTLKNEFVEVGRDVAEIGGGAATLARTGAGHVPHIVRSATGTLGDAVQQGSQVAVTATSGVISRSQRQARQALEDQLLTPIKRTWHLVVTGFLLCYLIPLFGLRTYAPLNSVVSNLGLVYAGVCICCPPRCARSRCRKGGMLILWPLCMVVMPLALHYWLTHPPAPARSHDSGRSAPQWYPPQVPQLWDRISSPGPGSGKGGDQDAAGAHQGGGDGGSRRGPVSGWSRKAEKDDEAHEGSGDGGGRWGLVGSLVRKPEKAPQGAWVGPTRRTPGSRRAAVGGTRAGGLHLRGRPAAQAARPGLLGAPGGSPTPFQRLLRLLSPRRVHRRVPGRPGRAEV